MKQKWIDAYMDMAERFSQLSTAVRLKVGAIIVKDHRVISIGYNGTPEGWDNTCEDIVDNIDDKGIHWYKMQTKDEVIHAEANAILKLAKDGESGKDSILFLTHSPCIHCAKMIYGSGIKQVYYKEKYRNEDGINFLRKCNVEIIQNEIRENT
jgi:dCMP deaminase